MRVRASTPRPLRLAVAAALALVLASPSVVAGPGAAPAGAATATLRSQRTVDVRFEQRHTATGTRERFSSPVLADLTGDDRPELVVAAPDGTITATRLDTGATLWERGLGATEIHATPVVEDLDGDGVPEVVAATIDGRVVLLAGRTGGVVRTFRQGAPLHCPAGQDCRPDGFFATPAVGDVNGDGRKDIVAPSYDHTVYAWSVGGTLLWRTYLEDTLWSSPAIVDIDRDGRQEVVLGGDIWAGNPFGVPAGGLFWALRGASGTPVAGYPRSLPGQVIWSSPVITDLDGDGRLDAVVGTGTNFPVADRKVWAFTLSTRRDLPGWPITTEGQVVQQPAVGDIDGDGQREVVVNTERGYLDAREANGSRRWVTCNANDRQSGCGGMVSHSGVVIADVDDDGVQEVVATSGVWLRVYDGRDRTLEAQHQLPGGYANLHTAAVPAVAELDGRTIIAQSAFLRAGGHSGAERAGDVVRTSVVTTDRPLCAQDWPAFKGGPRGTSVQPDRFPWHPFRCGRPFVAQQYADILGRNLDPAGRDYWTARLRSGTWSGPRVIEGFMASPEFGGVVAPIVRVHLALADGAPGPSRAIRAEVAAVRGGASLASVAQALIDADPTPPTSAQLVDDVYRRLVGRAPTSTERGQALTSVTYGGEGAWVASMAGRPDVVARLKGRVQVATTYVGLLDRAPDAGGWTYWVAAVAGGTSPQRLIEQFLNTSEYRARVL